MQKVVIKIKLQIKEKTKLDWYVPALPSLSSSMNLET